MKKWEVSLTNHTTKLVPAERYIIEGGNLHFYAGTECVACFAAGMWIYHIQRGDNQAATVVKKL